MARAISVGQIKSRARNRADMVNNLFVSEEWLMALINSAMTEVYDLLAKAGPPVYYGASVTYTTTAKLATYALPSDFRNAMVLYAVDPQDRKRPIVPINDYDRARFWAPQSVNTLELRYAPAPPVFNDDSNTFDGVSGWEELIVLIVAMNMMAKEESDTSGIRLEIAEMKQRIRDNSRRRGKGPRFITNLNRANVDWPYFGGCSVTGYQIFGNTIEFFEPLLPYYGR